MSPRSEDRTRAGTPGFQAARLTQAREARGLNTLLSLAGLLGVNTSTVSRWEDGTSSPSPDMLEKLAALLRVRPAFFLRSGDDSKGAVFFRSLAAARKRDRARQLARLEWVRDITEVVAHYIALPRVDVPDLLACADWRTLRDEDIEGLATELRRHWRLGLGPIANVLTPIEKAGIIVACDEMGTTNLDGLCRWSAADGRPYVLLATDKMNFFRRQMDAAHEMAHVVLHRGVDAADLAAEFDLVERQAFRLASAFLMPSETFSLAVAQPSMSRFRVLKDTWRVSIKAMIRRCQDLEILDRDEATQLYKYYSARGWSKGEPGDDVVAVAKPRLLAQALGMIIDEGLRTKEDLLASDFTLAAGDVEDLCGLTPGWFEIATGDVVSLQLRPREKAGQSDPGVVVPFGRKS